MNSKLFFSIILGLFFTTSVTAQCINGTDSYPIYKEGARLVSDFDDDGLEIVRIEYDLVFSSKDSYRYLSPDWEYSIYAFADDGVKDLDIYLWEYDDLLEEWSIVAEDSEDTPDALVHYQPAEYKEYLVEVVVSEFYEGYTAARYGLLYIHD